MAPGHQLVDTGTLRCCGVDYKFHRHHSGEKLVQNLVGPVSLK